jgi:hypothetical protein
MVSVILFQEGLLEAGAVAGRAGRWGLFFGDSPWREYMFFRPECKKKKGVFKKIFFIYFQLFKSKPGCRRAAGRKKPSTGAKFRGTKGHSPVRDNHEAAGGGGVRLPFSFRPPSPYAAVLSRNVSA